MKTQLSRVRTLQPHNLASVNCEAAARVSVTFGREAGEQRGRVGDGLSLKKERSANWSGKKEDNAFEALQPELCMVTGDCYMLKRCSAVHLLADGCCAQSIYGMVGIDETRLACMPSPKSKMCCCSASFC